MCIWKELYKQPYKDEIEDPVGNGVGSVSDARLRAIQGSSLLCVIDSLSVDYHIYLYYIILALSLTSSLSFCLPIPQMKAFN